MPSNIDGVEGYRLFTIYDLKKGCPLTFYGGIVVSKSEAKALRALRRGFHTHMKGIGMAETADCHVLIGHCTARLPLWYFIIHHLMGSFINANKNTGLQPNVREEVLEIPYRHPYSDEARVSKHLLYVAATDLPAKTELLSTYNDSFWNHTDDAHHDEAQRADLPTLRPQSG